MYDNKIVEHENIKRNEMAFKNKQLVPMSFFASTKSQQITYYNLEIMQKYKTYMM